MYSSIILFFLSIIIFVIVFYMLALLWFTDTRNRRLTGFFALGSAIAFGIFLNAIDMVIRTELFPFVFTLRSITLSAFPYGVFAFARSLTDIKFFKSKTINAISWILLVLDILIILTNPLHHLYYRAYTYPRPEYAQAFPVHYVFLIVIWGLGVILLLHHVVKKTPNRVHTLLLTLASILPMVLNMLFTRGIFLFNLEHDIVPFGCFIMFITFAILLNPAEQFNLQTIAYSSILTAFTDFYLVVDTNNIIIDTNMTADRLDISLNMVPGKLTVFGMISQIYPLTAHTEPANFFEELADFSKPFPGGEISIRTPHGDRTFTTTRQELYVGKRFTGYTMIFTDVSAYRGMIREINQQKEQLEILKETAESANAAKSSFLANMSHEMRTPLNAVIGLSELELGREDEEINPETRENIEKVYSSGMTLLGIINDILDISKIESGRFELIPAEYDIPSLINDTITLNIVRIGSKPIVFTLDIEDDLPARLIGDELRVKQILNNLLSNAFKYTREGSVRLGISGNKEGNAVRLRIRISDTGIGIKPEDRELLFHDYQQVDTGANRKIEGTGLGLSITKRMVEMMGGKISAESEYGKGSVFSFDILQGFVNDTTIGPAMAENLRQFKYSMGRRDRNRNIVRAYIPYAKVLVVDDVVTNLDVARGMLKPYGMTVDCVTSGQKAIDLVRAATVRYNAIFMDHMMPGMDGVEAVKKIRSEIGTEYAKTVPIIALTANAILGNEEFFLNNGFQAFLSKPIDIMRMNEVINRWVRNKELEKDLPKEQELPEQASKSGILADKKISGLDFVKALERFGGDEAYLETLRSYVNHTPPLLEKLQGEGTLADYAITVHGIKGSSYGICADAVGKLAEQLELAAKSGDQTFVESNTPRFIAETQKLLEGINALLKTLDGENSKPKKPAPDKELLSRIRVAAENYNIADLDIAMEELERYTYESQQDLVAWIREQIDLSEFDRICKRLET
ncbi:ATP-binding protein [Treponema primitia]|uniref:ATP-binding protein n=1 Tax=Treponema primitia TaxID=88058 RepID=UPI00397EDE42